MAAPFRVYKKHGAWFLQRSDWKFPRMFDTAGAAIDHAYKNWPWWP